jgi:hypothetical protein
MGKVKAPRREYVIRFDSGPLTGAEFVMGSMTARDIIVIRSGAMNEGESLDMVADRCIRHNVDVADLRELDYEDLTAILTRWGEALAAAALPEATAAS